MEEPTTNNLKDNCGNCQHPIGDAKYCSNCGQKNTDGRISFGNILSVFFSTVFNLESKFFQTMKDIIFPGKLTQEWFKGRHKCYFHPVRLFIVTALLLIASLSPIITHKDGQFMGQYREKAQKEHFRKNFIEEINNYSFLYHKEKKSKVVIDSLIKNLKEGSLDSSKRTIKKYAESNNFEYDKDKSVEEILTENQEFIGAATVDSIIQEIKTKRNLTRDSLSLNNFQLFMGDDKDLSRNIANKDFLNLSPEEIANKYGIEGYFKRLVFKQKIRLLQNGNSLLPFLLGNSLWVIFLMMPFLALILKLLYIRHNYYYMEHLVFSFHTHSFAFILFTIVTLVSYYYKIPWLAGISFLLLFIYLYKSLRKIYQQGRWKTMFKLLFANFFYIFLAVIFAGFGAVAGMLLF